MNKTAKKAISTSLGCLAFIIGGYIAAKYGSTTPHDAFLVTFGMVSGNIIGRYSPL